VKALRREHISNITQANRFLERVYLRQHNARFAITDHLRDVHRPVAGLDLRNIFCYETTRTVYNDYTITLGARFVQLERSEAPLPPPLNKVIVHRWLDGSLHIFWHEHEIPFTHLKGPPKHKPYVPHPAASSHPWHRSDLGRMSKRVKSRKSILASMKKSTLLPT
jgi:hypothetical protein